MVKVGKTILIVVLVGILLASIFQIFVAWMTEVLFEDLGSRDWHVALPNSYEIVQISGQQIVLVNKDAEGPTEYVVNSFVTGFCFNESFVGISAKLSRDSTDEPFFYLVDTVQDLRYGPYSWTDFLACCDTYGVHDLGEWIATVPTPNLAGHRGRFCVLIV